MAQYLTLEDLRLARTPEALLALFRKLGYRAEPELVPLDPDELEFPAGAGIRRLFLLADHDRLQIFLYELEAVQMAHLRLLPHGRQDNPAALYRAQVLALNLSLGILNTSLTEFFYRQISATIRGGFVRFFSQYLKQIPIPDAPRTARQAIEKLVRRLLALREKEQRSPRWRRS